MATSRAGSALILMGMLILGVIGIGVVLSVGSMPALNQHAWDKHQTGAQQAWNHINRLGAEAEHCKWSCNDGRDRYVCAMDGGQWAIVVVEGAQLITAFVTDQEYAKSVIDDRGCSNQYHYSHP